MALQHGNDPDMALLEILTRIAEALERLASSVHVPARPSPAPYIRTGEQR
jgi:hypothetical protein